MLRAWGKIAGVTGLARLARQSVVDVDRELATDARAAYAGSVTGKPG
jgi:hypothetical protein